MGKEQILKETLFIIFFYLDLVLLFYRKRGALFILVRVSLSAFLCFHRRRIGNGGGVAAAAGPVNKPKR